MHVCVCVSGGGCCCTWTDTKETQAMGGEWSAKINFKACWPCSVFVAWKWLDAPHQGCVAKEKRMGEVMSRMGAFFMKHTLKSPWTLFCSIATLQCLHLCLFWRVWRNSPSTKSKSNKMMMKYNSTTLCYTCHRQRCINIGKFALLFSKYILHHKLQINLSADKIKQPIWYASASIRWLVLNSLSPCSSL